MAAATREPTPATSNRSSTFSGKTRLYSSRRALAIRAYRSPSMIERFVTNRRPRWERLSQLLDRLRGTRHPLSIDELDEIAHLYRLTTSDLAIARRDFPEDGTTRFINELVARAYAQIY